MATKTSKPTSKATTSEAKYSFTPGDLTALRDDQQASWAKVAQAFSLGSPGAARRAYSALVRPHTQSTLAGVGRNGGGVTAVHLTGANLATVRDTITGKTIVVQRTDRTEQIPVTKVTSVSKGNVAFNDGNKGRTVKAEAIIAVK